MKRNCCPFCSSGSGIEYRNFCWFLQPATKRFARLAKPNNVEKLYYFTAEHNKLHLGDEAPPRWSGGGLFMHRRLADARLLRRLCHNRSWTQTTCRSPVLLLVGELHRGRRTLLLSQFGKLLLLTCTDPKKHVFHNIGPLKSVPWTILTPVR